MEHYAGLDVSLKEISICVVDHNGKTIARGACMAVCRRGRAVRLPTEGQTRKEVFGSCSLG